MVTRDIEAADVQVGTFWFVWGRHYEIVERAGTVDGDPAVRLQEVDAQGVRKKKPHPFLVAAWRIVKYGEPSLAFSAPR